MCWGVSEVSGVLCFADNHPALWEDPGNHQLGNSSVIHPPEPQCSQRNVHGPGTHGTTAKGAGTALLTPAHPSLLLKPWPPKSLVIPLGTAHGAFNTGVFWNSLPALVGLQQTTAFWLSTSCLFLKEDVRSYLLLYCSNLPRLAPGVYRDVAAQPRFVLGTLVVGLMPPVGQAQLG